MEDLLRSLNNLGLCAPDPTQLWQLLDDGDADVRARLIKLLAFNTIAPILDPLPSKARNGGGNGDISDDDDDDGEDEEGALSSSVASLMGQDLLQEAVTALLDNFRRAIERQRLITKREEDQLQIAIATNGVASITTSNGKGKASSVKKKVKLPPRHAFLARQTAALRKEEEDRLRFRAYRPRLVFDGSTSFHSKREVGDLRRIRCKDMDTAPKRYAGTYLLCRVITSVLLYVGVTFVVEDLDGTAIAVSISHFTSDINMTTTQASRLLPVGTVMAIREPLLSIDHQARAGPCAGRADTGVRVDSPTDVVVLCADDALLRDIQWQSELETPDSTGSLPWLTDANMRARETQDYNALANDFLAANRPGAAYRTLLRAGKVNARFDIALRARILFALGAWKEARDAYAEVVSSGDGGTGEDARMASDFSIELDGLTAAQARERCELRLSQAERGLTVEDIRSIYAAANSVPRFDTSDFIGPVAVEDISGAGRGLVTTRDVEAGELLLCCRAVTSAYPGEAESKGAPLMRLNVSNGVVSATSQVRAQTNLIHALVDRPELALPVLGLTAGPHLPYSEYVGKPFPATTAAVLDAEAALRMNKLPSLDASYIDGVLRFNAFGPAQSPARVALDDSDGELAKCTMSHPLPAILNHACLPNVSSVFYSDIVTTRPLARLPRGTEVVHQYVRGEEPYAIRAAQLSKHGFVCRCPLCVLDRADGELQCKARARIVQGELAAMVERSRILMKRVDLARLGSHDPSPFILSTEQDDLAAHRDLLDSLAQLQQRVDATHASERSALRPDLFAILELRVKHAALFDVEQAVALVVDAVRCVGGEVDSGAAAACLAADAILCQLPRLHMDGVIGLLLRVAVLYANAGQAAQHHQQQHPDRQPFLSWTRAAYRAHECIIGGGLEVFLDRWAGVPEYEPALRGFAPAA